MNPKLLALLRNSMNELADLRNAVDRPDGGGNREILLEALIAVLRHIEDEADSTKDGE